MVGTMALVIVLSVFNGFEKVVISMFNVFDPDLRITVSEGKTFRSGDLNPAIRIMPEVIRYTEVLEENALLRYKEKQYLATVKGVSPGFTERNPLDTLLIEGDLVLQVDSFDFALPGFGIAYYLDIHVDDPEGLITMYVPDRKKRMNILSESTLRSESIRPSGIFSVQQDFDNKYVFVPLRFARTLLDYSDEVTAAEIMLKDGANRNAIQEKISDLAGTGFQVKNRLQQQEILYKTMKSEKWAVFLILTFILIIATFNVIGSITMLILDKRKDIDTFGSMGATASLIRRIFFTEGVLITLSGAVAGLILGWLICWLQLKFELIKLHGGGSFIMQAYPVEMKWVDFVMVFLTVMFIGSVASWLSVLKLRKKT